MVLRLSLFLSLTQHVRQSHCTYSVRLSERHLILVLREHHSPPMRACRRLCMSSSYTYPLGYQPVQFVATIPARQTFCHTPSAPQIFCRTPSAAHLLPHNSHTTGDPIEASVLGATHPIRMVLNTGITTLLPLGSRCSPIVNL
jgi:hypothetical protein